MDNAEKDTAQIDPEKLIKEIKQLVSLPTVCIKVNQMVDDENCSATDIGKIISNDVSLSARLLKIANSAFYAFPSKIETISRAITIIGGTELRALVLATSAIETFDKIPIDVASMESFWRHSLQTAIVSRLIAKKCKFSHGEQMFVAGLLHDIGHLVLFQKYPELEKNVLVNAILKDKETYDEESNVFGFDHAYLGGELLKDWDLPASLVEPVKFHHQPGLAEEHKLETAIVHIANIVAKNYQLGVYARAFDQMEIDKTASSLIGFSNEIYNEILDELPVQYTNAVELFMPKLSAA